MIDMRKFLMPILFLLMLISCNNQSVPNPEILPERIIIVYLCGDNNLSSEVSTKITALQQAMKNIGKTKNRLIVFADYNNKMPELLEITADATILIEKYAEINSASAENFANILNKIKNNFPAKTYGLICFSHASGWLPQGDLNNPADFFSSENKITPQSIFEDKGREMSLADFANAIQFDQKLEFIIFETCYMAGVEVAFALQNKVVTTCFWLKFVDYLLILRI
jgi:hypothetical protein